MLDSVSTPFEAEHSRHVYSRRMATTRAELLQELLALADKNGWDRARTAAELGMKNQSNLSMWIKRGEVSAFGVEPCAQLGLYLVGNAAFEQETPNAEHVAGSLARRKEAPVVGQVKGGPDGFFEEVPMAVGDSDLFVPYWGRDPNAFGLRIVGDSMAPRYNHGEFVVACPNLPYARGKYVYVSLVTGQKLVKKIGEETVDAFEFLSVNNSYKPMTILKSDIERICVIQGPFDADDVRHQAP